MIDFLCVAAFTNPAQLQIFGKYAENTPSYLVAALPSIGYSGTVEQHKAFPYWVHKDLANNIEEQVRAVVGDAATADQVSRAV